MSLKECTKCGQAKPTSEFGSHVKGANGLRSRCKKCCLEDGRRWRQRNLEQAREQSRRWSRENPDRIRAAQIRSKYGLTVEAYEALRATGCAVCGSHERICVDHDHDTGEVRGALCASCNAALGLVGDSPERLRAAADYLENGGAICP